MNVRAINKLRQTLRDDRPALGLWVTLPATSVCEIAAAIGLDWVVIDAEHGELGWREIADHLRALVRSDTVGLVRLEESRASLIKRALDLGADGVVLPMIASADEAKCAVEWARYPLDGKRGLGGERATAWGAAIAEHVQEANEHVLVVPIIETVDGGREAAAIASAPGIEIVQLGPADYSASAGFAGQWEGPGVANELAEIKDAIRAAGRTAGVLATSPEDMKMRIEQGFRFIGLGMDAGLLIRSLRSLLESVGRSTVIAPDPCSE